MGYEEADDDCPLQKIFGEEEEVIISSDVCDEFVNDEGFEELPADSISKHSCMIPP